MVAERKSFGELGKVRRGDVPRLTVLSEATIRNLVEGWELDGLLRVCLCGCSPHHPPTGEWNSGGKTNR